MVGSHFLPLSQYPDLQSLRVQHMLLSCLSPFLASSPHFLTFKAKIELMCYIVCTCHVLWDRSCKNARTEQRSYYLLFLSPYAQIFCPHC